MASKSHHTNPDILSENYQISASLEALVKEYEARGETRGIVIGEAIGVIIGEERGEIRGISIGEIKGRAAEIVETGYEFRLSDQDIIKRLQDKLSISRQQALEYYHMYKNV